MEQEEFSRRVGESRRHHDRKYKSPPIVFILNTPSTYSAVVSSRGILSSSDPIPSCHGAQNASAAAPHEGSKHSRKHAARRQPPRFFRRQITNVREPNQILQKRLRKKKVGMLPMVTALFSRGSADRTPHRNIPPLPPKSACLAPPISRAPGSRTCQTYVALIPTAPASLRDRRAPPDLAAHSLLHP